MIYVIRPPVQEACRIRCWTRIAAYGGSILIVAGLVGAIAALSGSRFGNVSSRLVLIGVVSFMYAGVEIGLFKLPIPTHRWQLPREWLRFGYYRSAVLYGAGIGLGFATRTPFSTYHIMVVWQILSAQVVYGAILGVIYGIARLASLFVAGRVAEARGDSIVAAMRALFESSGYVRILNSIALSVFGAASITTYVVLRN